jgi:hypothetical protein
MGTTAHTLLKAVLPGLIALTTRGCDDDEAAMEEIVSLA